MPTKAEHLCPHCKLGKFKCNAMIAHAKDWND